MRNSQLLPSLYRRRIQELCFQPDSANGRTQLAKLCWELARRGHSLDDFLVVEGLEDLYRDHLESALEGFGTKRRGFLYLAANAAFSPGLYKIGMTRKTPESRRKSLTTAGVPVDFILVKTWEVPDVFGAESQCRRVLGERRVAREFYKGTYTELTTLLDELVENEHDVARRLCLSCASTN